MKMRKVFFPTSEKRYTQTLISQEDLQIGDFVESDAQGNIKKLTDSGSFFGVVMSLSQEKIDEKTGEILPETVACIAREGEISFVLDSTLLKKPFGTYVKPTSKGWQEAKAGEEAYGVLREVIEPEGAIEFLEGSRIIEVFRLSKNLPASEAKPPQQPKSQKQEDPNANKGGN